MFVNVANKVKPAVVSIITKHANEVKEKTSERIGFGSGMIIDPEGYILTADFVVADTEDIEVIFPDKREFKGELKGMDKRFGVAVIKIDAKGLPVVEFGDSDALKVTQFVMAAGYGHGGLSFTVGVINALNRRLSTPSNYVISDFIQTDVAMLPGFGGGPLVNMKGEVIGILYIRVVDAVSYAIPVNSVKQAIDRLIKHGRVTRGWLGIGIEDINPELAKSLGLPDLNGVFVTEVFSDAPAEKSGLKVEDVIRSFDGKEVKSSRDLM
ncbi:MAG: trypsin-like peptidase domain-containing protein, partial [Nitrospinae bacterium]|nr:trypsin-like peptidase domain-containing protein [Nitrospinota bacterium]